MDNVKGQGMARWHGDLVRVRGIMRVNKVDGIQKKIAILEKKIDRRREEI